MMIWLMVGLYYCIYSFTPLRLHSLHSQDKDIYTPLVN